MKTYRLSIFILMSFVSYAQPDADNKALNYTYKIIVPDLTIPWGFAFLPDHSMLITEKRGELIHFNNGKKTSIKGLPDIEVLGQGGLMDIRLHPDYVSNGWIYISYASPKGKGDGANTAILRGRLKNNTLVDKEVLYKAAPNTTRGQHFGSRIVFDNSGYLYFSIGDRGNRDNNPQSIERDGGKIYRLHDNGKIPEDNPFVNSPNAKPAIYSYGHRNPQGMAIHPETGKLWIHEHGPRGGDEINIVERGKNYGWPKIGYGINYHGTKYTNYTHLPGMEQPIHYWDPSIAPSGMAFITGGKYPRWNGNLLIGSLKFQYLNNCVLDNEKVVEEEKLLEGSGRVRSVRQGPDGYIHVGVENVGIVKIIPK